MKGGLDLQGQCKANLRGEQEGDGKAMSMFVFTLVDR